MKIKDLITLKKINEDRYTNVTQLKYFRKNKYYWEIPSHSQNEGVLLNNYEKDCVVAYVDNRYFTTFLIKLNSNNYRGFCYVKDFLKGICGSYSYTISDIWNEKTIIDLFEQEGKNLVMVEDEEYGRFKRFLILKGMDL